LTWAFCGAVPLTRAALQNPMVPPELPTDAPSDDDDDVAIINREEGFDWSTATLQQIENVNNAACDKLLALGIDAKQLRLKAPRIPAALNSRRLPNDATVDEQVRALANIPHSLSSVWFTLGAQSISSNQVLQSAELRERESEWKKIEKKRNDLVAKKAIEEKAKGLLERGPNEQRGWSVPELRSLLKWKMSVQEFSAEKANSISKEKLLALWEIHKGNKSLILKCLLRCQDQLFRCCVKLRSEELQHEVLI